MRPTFIGFETAKSSLRLSQKNLDIVGNNLANINTAGYTRQRVTSAAVAPNLYAQKIASSKIDLAGQGVEAIGVGQTRDSFLDKRFRDEYASSSYYIQTNDMLSDVQTALGDASDITSGGNMVADGMKQIYNALNDYADNPTSAPHANLVLSAFSNMTQVLHKLSTDLDNVANQQKYDLGVSVDKFNTTLEKIAKLNDTIVSNAASTLGSIQYDENDLLDQRNLLLDDASSYGDLSFNTESDGSVTVTMGNQVVVSGGKYDGLLVSEDKQYDTTQLLWKSSGTLANFAEHSGSLRATTDVLNGRGANVQNPGETSVQGDKYYKDRLDTFAQTLATTVNSIIPQMQGAEGKMTQVIDADGNRVFKTLLAARVSDDGTTDNNTPITAANISISHYTDPKGDTSKSCDWVNGRANYLFSDVGSTSNAKYAEQMSSALVGTPSTFQSYGETFKGTFEEYLVDYTSRVGTDTAYYSNLQKVSSAVSNDLLDRRDEVSGVQMDDETSDMMTNQKSYNAAARLMTTLDQMLDTLINSTGTVGR